MCGYLHPHLPVLAERLRLGESSSCKLPGSVWTTITCRSLMHRALASCLCCSAWKETLTGWMSFSETLPPSWFYHYSIVGLWNYNGYHVCVLPNWSWNLNPQGDDVRKWGLWKVVGNDSRELVNEMNALCKGPLESLWLLLCENTTTKESSARNRALVRALSCYHLHLKLPSSRTVRNKFL